jgi:uncharacterized membrane protein YgcG
LRLRETKRRGVPWLVVGTFLLTPALGVTTTTPPSPVATGVNIVATAQTVLPGLSGQRGGVWTVTVVPSQDYIPPNSSIEIAIVEPQDCSPRDLILFGPDPVASADVPGIGSQIVTAVVTRELCNDRPLVSGLVVSLKNEPATRVTISNVTYSVGAAASPGPIEIRALLHGPAHIPVQTGDPDAVIVTTTTSSTAAQTTPPTTGRGGGTTRGSGGPTTNSGGSTSSSIVKGGGSGSSGRGSVTWVVIGLLVAVGAIGAVTTRRRWLHRASRYQTEVLPGSSASPLLGRARGRADVRAGISLDLAPGTIRRADTAGGKDKRDVP